MASMKKIAARPAAVIIAMITLATVSGCKWFKHASSDPMTLTEYRKHVMDIDQAEEIDDPVKRCMRYPTPPEFKWSKELIEALCADLHTPIDHLPKIKRLIDAKDWSGLEAHYTDILRRHYSGEDPEYLIYRSFPLSSWKSPQEADDYTLRWLKAAPDDAYANMARGNVLNDRAWGIRGADVASKTDKKQLKKAEMLAREAETLLRKASILQPRLVPAYRALMNAEMLAGHSDKIADSFDQAIRQSPHSYYLRNTLINFLEPKWGGTLSDVDWLVEEAQPHAARNPRIALLRARRIGIDADRFLSRKWHGNALDRYRESIAVGPDSDILITAGNVAYREKHYGQAMMYWTQALRFTRYPADALTYRGWAWDQLHEGERAYCDYRAAVEADPGQESAKRNLASHRQLLIDHKVDPAKACGPGNPSAKRLRKKWA